MIDQYVNEWLQEHRKRSALEFKRIELNHSKEWSIAGDGRIRHKTGGFFSIIGVKSSKNDFELFQPLINQPEIGILGFLIRPAGDSWEILCQAKTEPGNILESQIAPTFQATKSNYNQIHGGKPQAYASLFLDKQRSFIADQLQSEQGFRFWRKRNRNCVTILEDDEKIQAIDSHLWISLDWILLHLDNDYLFNTDFRSVIVQLFLGYFFTDKHRDQTLFNLGWHLNWDSSNLEFEEVYAWVIKQRELSKIKNEPCSLLDMTGWLFTESGIESKERPFGIKYYDIYCRCREVFHWDQPLMTSLENSINRLVICVESRRLYLLLQFRMEPGAYDVGELSCTTHSMDSIEAPFFPRQLSWQLAESSQLLKTVATSEEGGRFFQDKTVNEIYLSETCFNPENKNYTWVSIEALCGLIHKNNVITNELRTIISILLGCQIG